MRRFQSFLAPAMQSFFAFQEAADRWNGTYEQNIHLFDAHCFNVFPEENALTKEMVDSWCRQRKTESGNSCRVRVYAVANFINYLRVRGHTDITPPDIPRMARSGYVPHAFTSEELSAFFHASDSLPSRPGSRTVKARGLIVPVFFRLLYSSGIRTNEARHLGVDDVDMPQGILSIEKSKGRSQRYVALHDTMTALLMKYDSEIREIYPARTFFFPSPRGSFLSNSWVVYNFNQLWGKVSTSRATAYCLRHNYAVENINQWDGDGFESFSKIVCLSKSMGHASLESTKGYFHLVPAMSNILQSLSGEGFDGIVPEVCDEKSYW